MDCVGLLMHVASEVGCSLQDSTCYASMGNLEELVMNCDRDLNKLDKLTRGAWVIVRVGRNSGHLALFTGTTLIHTYDLVGRVVEHRLDEKWRNRIVGFYSLKQQQCIASVYAGGAETGM